MLLSLLLAAGAAATTAPAPAATPASTATPAAAASPAPAAKPAAPPAYFFALSNADGSKVISLAPIASPEKIVKATCSGKLFDLAFKAQQKAGPNDNGRQTAQNFDQMEGAVFAVKGGPIDSDSSCLLGTSGFFTVLAPVPVEPATADCAPGDAPTAAALGKRAVASCMLVGKYTGGKLVFVQFAPKGNSLLAGLVLLGDKVSAMHGFPATRPKDSQDCWRADDGCTFNEHAYHVPFLMTGAGGLTLFGLWDGPEGQNIELLNLKGTSLDPGRINASRNWSPE